MKHLLRCTSCSMYTMKESCPNCGQKTLSIKPPKYSPLDKYAKYRRIASFEKRKEEAVL